MTIGASLKPLAHALLDLDKRGVAANVIFTDDDGLVVVKTSTERITVTRSGSVVVTDIEGTTGTAKPTPSQASADTDGSARATSLDSRGREASPSKATARGTHVIFTNQSRTELLQAWDASDDEGPRWTCERASRQTPEHTWGAPTTARFYGDIDRLTRHAETLGLTEREQ